MQFVHFSVTNNTGAQIHVGATNIKNDWQGPGANAHAIAGPPPPFTLTLADAPPVAIPNGSKVKVKQALSTERCRVTDLTMVVIPETNGKPDPTKATCYKIDIFHGCNSATQPCDTDIYFFKVVDVVIGAGGPAAGLHQYAFRVNYWPDQDNADFSCDVRPDPCPSKASTMTTVPCK